MRNAEAIFVGIALGIVVSLFWQLREPVAQSVGAPVYLSASSPTTGGFYVIYPQSKKVFLCGAGWGDGGSYGGAKWMCGPVGTHP